MSRLPTLFVSHGAPTFALEPGLAGAQLRALGEALPRPEAVLVVSPHWMTPALRVATGEWPQTIHDFGGFDPALHEMRYPAAGHPVLARRTIEALAAAGWPVAGDARRGLDHGAWVPLMHLYPRADVPVFQVALPARADARVAWMLGEALAPLADAGVLVVGSGSLTHNLHEFRPGEARQADYVEEFAHWIRDAVIAGDAQRLRAALEIAPHARRAHPTPEHFLPLLVAAGAAAETLPATVIEGGIVHGVLSMDGFVFGALSAGRAATTP